MRDVVAENANTSEGMLGGGIIIRNKGKGYQYCSLFVLKIPQSQASVKMNHKHLIFIANFL